MPFAAEDVVFFAREPGSKARDHEDIMLRRVPRTVADVAAELERLGLSTVSI